jgi:type VI secretion system protein VasI
MFLWLTLAMAAPSPMEVCASIDDETKRLACYDLVAKSPPDPAPKPTPKSVHALDGPPGGWRVSSSTDPITDELIVTAILPPNDPQTFRRAPSLVVRCRGESLDVYVLVEDFLGNRNDPEVTMRLDDRKPETQEWGLSADFTAVFHPAPVWLARQFHVSKKLAFRVSPYSENPLTAVFDLTGYARVSAELGKACPKVTAIPH